jgi:hypothetical protein
MCARKHDSVALRKVINEYAVYRFGSGRRDA